jgi:hypothetical protein
MKSRILFNLDVENISEGKISLKVKGICGI